MGRVVLCDSHIHPFLLKAHIFLTSLQQTAAYQKKLIIIGLCGYKEGWNSEYLIYLVVLKVTDALQVKNKGC